MAGVGVVPVVHLAHHIATAKVGRNSLCSCSIVSIVSVVIVLGVVLYNQESWKVRSSLYTLKVGAPPCNP